MAKSVYTQEERRAQFLKTGLKLARKTGVAKVSVSSVAAEHSVTAPLVFHIFGNREKFHAELRAEAKKQKIVLPADAAVKDAPKRKRSVAEVKAIKRKVVPGKDKRKVVEKSRSKPATAAKKEKAKTAAKKFTSLPVPTVEKPDASASPLVAKL